MPCYHPLQAVFSVREDGKKSLKFLGSDCFSQGVSVPDMLLLPCGKCIGCRLERSRQWAVRIMHEAQLYEDNCFVTLTFDDHHLSSECVNRSLSKRHVQLFMKKLRQKFSDRKIRFFYCGEYGENLGRPHYHLCLFNLDFSDKKLWSVRDGHNYFTSDVLADLWPYGFCIISDLTFDSAAYVARYCVKKVNGKDAEKHYGKKLPEFCQASLKPGIGALWLDKFGKSDVFPFDEVVVRGVKCKPPRYYDKLLAKISPECLDRVKKRRAELASSKAEDNSFQRLLDKETCVKSRISNLVRNFEKEYV